MTRLNLDEYFSYGQAANFLNRVGGPHGVANTDFPFNESVNRKNDWFASGWTKAQVRDFMYGNWQNNQTKPYLQLGRTEGISTTFGGFNNRFLQADGDEKALRAIMIDASPLGKDIAKDSDNRLNNMYTGSDSFRIAFLKMENAR
jgi:hypothetical protein